MNAATARTRQVHCQCGAWLGDVEMTGQRQWLRLRRCRRCKGWPVVAVHEDGRYAVVLWTGRVEPEALPWPVEGWR